MLFLCPGGLNMNVDPDIFCQKDLQCLGKNKIEVAASVLKRMWVTNCCMFLKPIYYKSYFTFLLLFHHPNMYVFYTMSGPSYGIWITTTFLYLCNPCLSPLKLWVRIPLMPRCTRYNIMWDNVCQWLAVGQWFSPGTTVSSTNKT